MFHEVKRCDELDGRISYVIAVRADWQGRAFAAGWRFNPDGQVEVDACAGTEAPPRLAYALEDRHHLQLFIPAEVADARARRVIVQSAIAATGSHSSFIALE